ncbi:kinesin-like protein KIN-4A isoform X1 [Tanacetum coccineum]
MAGGSSELPLRLEVLAIDDTNHKFPSSVHKVLSNDDLLMEILLRLPVVSLHIFKPVCKQWPSLITSPTFTLTRTRSPTIDPPSGLIIGRWSDPFGYDFVSFDPRIPAKSTGSPSSAIFEECVSPLVDGLFQFKDIMLLFLLMARFGQDIHHGHWLKDGCQTGLVPLAMNALFRKIESLQNQTKFQFHFSFIELRHTDVIIAEHVVERATAEFRQQEPVEPQIHLLLPVAFHQLKQNATSTNIHLYGRKVLQMLTSTSFRVLPPHMSPFVDTEAEGYVPEYADTIKRLQAS